MTYLWASASLGTRPLRPSGAAHLARRAAYHLSHGERFTLYMSHARRPFGSAERKHRAYWIRYIADQFSAAIDTRCDSPFETVMATRSLEFVVQFIPHDEWHPTMPEPAQLAAVECDASYYSTKEVRGGIHTSFGVHRIDLTPVGVGNNTEAEFITLCLATLIGAGQRAPLRVRSDCMNSVEMAHRLRDGQLPRWVRDHGSELAERITIAATTSVRLRPVEILHAPRKQTMEAHKAASVNIECNELLHPRNYARTQGMLLSWQDRQRGLSRPTGGACESPPSWCA